jgi:hypothetical protein
MARLETGALWLNFRQMVPANRASKRATDISAENRPIITAYDAEIIVASCGE